MYVDPLGEFTNTWLHGIGAKDVLDAPTFPDLYPALQERFAGRVVVSHAAFDPGAFRECCKLHALAEFDCRWVDSVRIARDPWPDVTASGAGLKKLCAHFGIVFDHHDALSDATATAEIVRLALAQTGASIHRWIGAQRRGHRQRNGQQHRDTTSTSDPRKIVFSGNFAIAKSEPEVLAAAAGFEVQTSVTRNTAILCVGRQDPAPSMVTTRAVSNGRRKACVRTVFRLR